MAGLADAFRMPVRRPQQPMARDPLMPVPQMGPQMGPQVQRPLYTQEEPQGFMSPGFADFLRNYYLPRQSL